MAGDAYRIELIGADALVRRLLERDTWFYAPVKRALAKIGQMGRTAARAAAPVDTGRLRSSITYRVNTRVNAPRFVAIATRATRLTGQKAPFAYPRILEFSPGRHKGWMLRAIAGIKSSAASALASAGREIERQWAAHRGAV